MAATSSDQRTSDRKPSERVSARDRLLAAADELFYEEGVNTVGIDRVIERAGVAKASLYSTFGSKDELIRAYLEARHEARKERVTRAMERYDTPRERLLGIFDVLGEAVAEPGFHGCAFQNATTEARPGSVAEQVANVSRVWTKSLFREQAAAAGAADPDRLAQQLFLLYDGALVSARMDHDLEAAGAARTAAVTLIDAATRR
jgi:AcrR family transcriptional regulator